jgi:hypothetical protein
MTFHILLSCNPAAGQQDAAADLLRRVVLDLTKSSVVARAFVLAPDREQSDTGRPFRFTLVARGETDPRAALLGMLTRPAFQRAFRLFALQPISAGHAAAIDPAVAADLLQVCAAAQPDQEGAFEAFYEQTHFAELLAVPGFASGQLLAVEKDQSQPGGEPHRYVSLWQLTGHGLASAELAKRRGTPALTPNPAGDRSKLESAFYSALV